MKEIEKELDGSSARRHVPGGPGIREGASLREKEKVLRHRDEELKREWEKNKGKAPSRRGRRHRVHRLR